MRGPTSIINRQKRLVEVGRIRLGAEKPKENKPGRPLATFRFTSRNQTALAQIATLWGGEITEWTGHRGQFQIYTQATEIPIWVAPQPPSQAYEFYTKGGMQRRCDGETCVLLKDGKEIPKKCACFAGGDQTAFGLGKDGCSLYTRVQVMLPDIPAVGVWLMVTQSWYAAMEIPTVLGYLKEMTEAVLAIEQRESVSNNQTKHYNVPVIRLEAGMTFRTVMTGELPQMPAIAPQEARTDVEGSHPSEEPQYQAEGQEDDTGAEETLEAEFEDVGEPLMVTGDEPILIADGDVTAHVPIAWPVFGLEADEKLKDLGFTPGEAKDLEDSGVTSEQVMIAQADTKEGMRVALE